MGVTESLDEGSEERPGWRRAVPIVLGLLLILALGSLFYFASRASEERERALALQRHSYEVINLARKLDGTIAHAETLLARYVVSMDSTTGRQYQDMWRNAGGLIESLRRSTRDSEQQQENVKALSAAYASRGTILNDIALRTTYAQRLGALGRFYAAGKAESVKRLNDAVEATIAFEQEELKHRNLLVDQSQTQIDRLYNSSGLVGLVLLVAALLALWVAYGAANERIFARRIAAAEAARVDGLEAAVRARTEELQVAYAQLQTEVQERAQAEESLRQMQKMEAIGKLTGGIAHDFNNMLAVVVGGLELARRSLGKNTAAAARHIDSAMDGATRAGALTQRLLAFARAEPLLPDQIAPDELVLGMRDLIDRTIGDQIEVKLEVDAGDWRLWADRTQLENALLNLAVNARDAMDGRGDLTIATSRVTLGEKEVGQCRAGDYIRLSVKDTGCGMTPEVLAHVFEPFYTTKAVGKGTGLGLSQIFGFVSQCQGEIRIDTAPGEGAAVHVYLPRDTMLREATPAKVQPVAPSSGKEERIRSLTVLVVEDDARVLGSTMAALKALGHKGISCDHPSQAGPTIAAHEEIDVILSDVLMPDMTGPEMVAALKAEIGRRPVIFVTGFAGDGERAAQMAGHHVLRKPFTLSQLAHAIALVTEESAPKPRRRRQKQSSA